MTSMKGLKGKHYTQIVQTEVAELDSIFRLFKHIDCSLLGKILVCFQMGHRNLNKVLKEMSCDLSESQKGEAERQPLNR